jgi:branched-chain amino acid transport system substrate-binding protein
MPFMMVMRAPGIAAATEAIRAMDTTEGPARFFPGGRLKFEDNGRRSGAALLIVQWQNGEPKVVYPAASAMAKPVWSKK